MATGVKHPRAYPPKQPCFYRLWPSSQVTAVNPLCKADVWVGSQDQASMDTGGFKIDKLNDKNYHTWKQKIELLLPFRDLDEVVFGDPPPDMATDEEVAYAFKKLDEKAKAVIGLTLSDEHLEHVRDAQTAADVWKCLMNVFQRCSLLNKLAARRRFYTVSMGEDENMLGYINRARHIADELKSMECVVGDEEVVMAILMVCRRSMTTLLSRWKRWAATARPS
jgi:gag-polypeptide of LTR copia-type